MRTLFAGLSPFLILVFLNLSCAHQGPVLNQKPTAFVSHPDWIGIPLDFASNDQIRKDMENRNSEKLKSRGEVHVTLLTPPEFQSFQNQIPMSELEDLIRPQIQDLSLQAQCVGVGSKGPLKTYYLVMKSPELIALRHQIKKKIEDKIRKKINWDPEHYFPHATLGFTERDLHESDGVIKDLKSCRFEL